MEFHHQCEFSKQIYIAPEDFKESLCGSSSKKNGWNTFEGKAFVSILL